MPRYRQPRRLSATKPKRQGRPDLRDHDAYARNWGDRPSERFEWDRSLTLHAIAMRDLGYPLSDDQKRRIDDHG